ncbi:MAG: (d)CMP kinase [Pseudomonadales bacterium]|jgi:cytidylate kinase|nr:(d)CMP kinase [Pseudomonadales bacterium]
MRVETVITVDGPSGTGKGTLAQRLARHLGWHFLDSGALYRITALGTEAAGIAPTDTAGLCAFAARMDVAFATRFAGSIVLDGAEISDQVRLEESGAKASIVAAIPELRAALLQRQRDFRQPPGLIADGRDMGTVVFPDAALKFYLTASAEERAHRRYKQLINKGVDVSLRSLLRDIQARDERDSTRAVAPLRPAEDAIIVDTDTLTADAVFALACQHVDARLGLRGA